MAQNRIQELRKENNLTLKGLSDKLAEKGLTFSDSQLSQYEQEKRSPRSKVADDFWKALSEIFGVTVQYLRGYTMYKDDKDFLKDVSKGRLNLTGLEWHELIGQTNLSDFQNLLKQLSTEQRINILSLLEYVMISYINSTYDEEDFIYLKMIFRNVADMTQHKSKITEDTLDNRNKALGSITKSVIDYLDNVQAFPDNYNED